ncbi:hypothetical protein ACFWIB_38645 [Streptomyces sp. NPDC127051]
MEPLNIPAIDCPFLADSGVAEHPHAREATEELLGLLQRIGQGLPS